MYPSVGFRPLKKIPRGEGEKGTVIFENAGELEIGGENICALGLLRQGLQKRKRPCLSLGTTIERQGASGVQEDQYLGRRPYGNPTARKRGFNYEGLRGVWQGSLVGKYWIDKVALPSVGHLLTD